MNAFDGGLLGLNEDALYDLGRRIGEISRNRPDITHRVLVGVRDGMVDAGSFSGYGFGELLEALERHWFSHLVDRSVIPPIPFVKSNTISGSGRLQFQIVSRRRSSDDGLPSLVSSRQLCILF